MTNDGTIVHSTGEEKGTGKEISKGTVRWRWADRKEHWKQAFEEQEKKRRDKLVRCSG